MVAKRTQHVAPNNVAIVRLAGALELVTSRVSLVIGDFVSTSQR